MPDLCEQTVETEETFRPQAGQVVQYVINGETYTGTVDAVTATTVFFTNYDWCPITACSEIES